MSWRHHGKRATVNPLWPVPFATCDRCGSNVNLNELRFQYDWAGASYVNKRLLVCSRCMDKPAPFLKSLKLPMDPEPVLNARPEPYSIDESHPNYIFNSDGSYLLASDGSTVLTSS